MIINIRGTGGSGKSWTVNQLFARFPVATYDKAALGHVLNNNTLVLGPYLTGVSTEGTDVVTRRMTQDELQRVVRAGSACHPNVLFEGLIVSVIYGRWRDLARELPDYRWVFLNTPLEQCIANTKKRRRRAGKPEEFNPKATIDKYRSVRSVLAKARADRLQVWDVSSDDAVDLIAGWIV